jgi:hypothetical protein
LYDGRRMKIDGDDLGDALPPLDDDEHGDDVGDDGSEDIDSLPDQDGDPPGDGLETTEVDDVPEVLENDGGGGEEDDEQTDVGDLDADFNEPDIGDAAEADVAGPPDLDPDLEDEPVLDDDAGAEGTSELADQMIDADLPPLDADDEGDFEEALLRETGLVGDAADESWQECAERWRPAPFGGRPSGDITALAFDPRAPDVVIGATLDARVFVSTDGGATAAASDGWRDRAATGFASGDRAAPVVASWGARRAIVVACGNFVAQSADCGATWQTMGLPRGAVVAMAACADGSIAALSLDAAGWWLCRSADGAAWSERALGLVARSGAGGQTWLACAGEALAIGDRVGISLSRDGGLTFEMVAGCTASTAGVFAGEDAAAPLVAAAVGDSPGGGSLLAVDHLGNATTVARLRPGPDSVQDDDDAEAVPPALLALAWDGARLWGAGRFGIAVWQARRAAHSVSGGGT